MTKHNELIIRILANFSQLVGASFVGIKRYTSVKSGEIANFVINANFSYGKAIKTSIAILKSLTDANFTAIAEKYGVVNHEGEKYATNKGATEYLATGKLPKEGTKARINVLKGVHETKLLSTIVAEMIKSFEDNQNEGTKSAQSIAQSEMYEPITNGVKRHKENKLYYIWAMAHPKEVIEEGTYADSTPKIETAQKNAIERYCKDVLTRVNSKGKTVSAVLPTTKYRLFVCEEDQLCEVNVNGDTVSFVD